MGEINGQPALGRRAAWLGTSGGWGAFGRSAWTGCDYCINADRPWLVLIGR